MVAKPMVSSVVLTGDTDETEDRDVMSSSSASSVGGLEPRHLRRPVCQDDGVPSRNELGTCGRLVRDCEPSVADRQLAVLPGIVSACGPGNVRNRNDDLTA